MTRRTAECGEGSRTWLADAASSVGGRVTSVEIDPARSKQAAENLARAGLDAHADLVVGDIADVLAGSSDGAWDFVLLDAERPAYVEYWCDLVRTLAPGGLLAVDNVVSTPTKSPPSGWWSSVTLVSSRLSRPQALACC